MSKLLKYSHLPIVLMLLFAGVSHAQVQINEIMYHPGTSDSGDDFIELYNNSGSSVNLTGWSFDGINFTFPLDDTIDPWGYLVIVSDATQFFNTYGVTADGVYIDSELSDAGERIALKNAGMVVQDEVIFSDHTPWPVTPDGLGPSLEVIDPDQDNSIPRNWHASAAAGGTPRALNSVDASGLPPWIEDVQHTQNVLQNDPVVVTATVYGATSVQLTYKIDWGGETTIDMYDDGAHGDGDPGDLEYGASIPGQLQGTLIRYRISVTDGSANMYYPRDDDTVTYDGTAVIDPALTSSLPILHWFIDPGSCSAGSDNPGAACTSDSNCPNGECDGYAAALYHKLTNETEPAVLFYDGVLYDGVQARIRGQSARYWDKPPWKFYMAQGHELAAPDVFDTAVDTFDLQSNWSDKAFMREVLAWETHRDAGGVFCQAHPVHVQKNGVFFGLYTFLEAPELDWVERNGLDPDGARYKAFDDMRSYSFLYQIEPKYEKKSRLEEGYDDIYDFTVDLNYYVDQQLRDFLYDNVDIPRTLNYLATQVIIHNNDHIKKNYFVYRDTMGTQRWTMQPWDLDLTFGRNWVYDVLVDTIWADVDYLTGLSDISPSHPYFGTDDRQKLGGAWNRLIDRLLDEDDIRQMYCRRLRSLMDELLPVGRYETRIDELAALIGTEVPLDHTEWGQWGLSQDLATAVTILKDEYLNPRRVHLYTTHGACSIPGPQGVTPNVLISEIMYNPTGGLDDEFIELYNPSLTDAVDISGWRLDGLALTVPPGTVILPQGYVLFVRNDPQFRTTYGGGKFVAAQYAGSLDDLGESIVLRNRYGGVINAVAYDDTDPWPAGAAGGGYSLELIDATQDNAKVVNWGASSAVGGTPGAANSIQGTVTGVPALYINEVLPDNVSINQDEGLDYDPWIEIYNASSQTIDLGGMYLSNDFGVPDMWQIPASTNLAAGDWMIFWADAETGEGTYHTNFTLSLSGGSVALFSSGGQLIDYLNYGALASDRSYGRFPDSGADLRIFTLVTPEDSNDVPPVPMILNEYNAVDDLEHLDGLKQDSYWGRIPGNGGDWFELVVTMDHVDARGWDLEITNDTGGAGETSYTLTLGSDPVWGDLRAGTIITVSENLADDVSFDPEGGDWWINVQASNSGSGFYITAQDFEVSNSSWQLTIDDNDTDGVAFGPVGEGIWPLSGVNEREVFKLEEDPSPYVTPVSSYNDGTSSTFGAPNIYANGSRVQDFTSLREIGIIGECSGPDTDTDGYCDSQDNCPTTYNPGQDDWDGDGIGDLCDSCMYDALNDAEGDTWCADEDNCPTVPNAGQEDGDTDDVGDDCDNCPAIPNNGQQDDDSDDIGDACDACPGDDVNDPDTDGWCASVDNCPLDYNPGQEDADSDGAGNACDSCPFDAYDDIDLDGFCADVDNCPLNANPLQEDGDSDDAGDLCDNCPVTPNPGQEDSDYDTLGDGCDSDDDNDGVDDGPDNCDLVPNGDQKDSDSDGQGDACDGDDDADGINDDVDNCPLNHNVGQADGDSDGVGDDCDCRPLLSNIGSAPGQLGHSLRIDKSGGGTLKWSRGPQGFASNVYRGTFAFGQPSWPYDESCIHTGLADTSVSETDEPVTALNGYYYLVSGVNTCGEGPAGEDSDGADIIPVPQCSTPGAADFDSDGVDDLEDNCVLVSNLSQDDTDDDFVGDLCDNCFDQQNSDQADLDSDTLGDVCDSDRDGDGHDNGVDSCPDIPNADQADTDSDDVGDACDPCIDIDSDGLGSSGAAENRCPHDFYPNDPENDADGDGVVGPSDNCPYDYNPNQLDSDLDGLGDTCDICPYDIHNDIDSDGICAGNCDIMDLIVVEFTSPSETVLVEEGSAMVYLANDEDPGIGIGWKETGFDDNAWTAGTYGAGYEVDSGAENLIQTTVPVGTLSLYTRADFEIADRLAVDDLWLGADYDDGYVAWINGVEVYRSPQMPVGEPAWDADPSSHESSNGSSPDYGVLIDISTVGIPQLVDGTNVLAVAVYNRIISPAPSTDLVLVPKLSMNRETAMSYKANTEDPLITGMTWAEESYDDSTWDGGNYGVGFERYSGGASDLIETWVLDGTYSIYTRTHFTIRDMAIIDDVLVGADYDDGWVAWINGTEVYRSPEMPYGALTWDTSPSLHESSNGTEPDYGLLEEVSDLAVPVMHEGINVYAVAVWNNTPGSSDIVIVPTLATNGLGKDNCPEDNNPDQTDTDNDGIGDLCDNCPAVFNPVQTDSDGDGQGDVCDL